MAGAEMYRVIVDSLSTHVAVLDENGIIVETNRAWQEFARKNGMRDPVDCVGLNYLSTCETGTCDEGDSLLIGRAIRQVIAGEIEEFLTQYPCHSPGEQRWYSLRVVPYRDRQARRVIVTHENITPIILAQEKLRSQEKELHRKTEKLEETNIALKVLLDHRQRDREQLEERIVANIRELAVPYLQKLLDSLLEQRQRTLVDIVVHHLDDIISPFLNRLSAINLLLTPQEIEVAAMVRQGKSSQEIADVLGVSVATISFHRKKLRRKLGLSRKGTNLRTYLLSLQ
ncbi:LuxR C-terminal-related transcriptional regulator [uncultured Desulfobulbus sp.]|uniref:LuxR C-terminal-related transcriptional regulator n=1 Tax=uncultured Desulfobulbus sp. TaxID=239745 RepID=UPI0029C8D4E4|nr:LuxR C-terminal-related transcriptional regulator [uncultured Desulfobulbus sp.]